jgi:hypothetical protein
MLPAWGSDSFYKQLSFSFREVCLQPVHPLVTGSPAAHPQMRLLYLTNRGAVVPKHADGNNKSNSYTNTNSTKSNSRKAVGIELWAASPPQRAPSGAQLTDFWH